MAQVFLPEVSSVPELLNEFFDAAICREPPAPADKKAKKDGDKAVKNVKGGLTLAESSSSSSSDYSFYSFSKVKDQGQG